MKKIFMIAVCIAAGELLFAQSPHFGLKAGVNIASLNVENGVDYNSRASFYAGGLVHIHVAKHLAIQPELFYSGQGGETGNTKIRLGYLNMPVLVQYMAGNGFRLQTGPQLGLLVSAESETGGVKLNQKDNFNKIDFTWAFGASYQFPGTGAGIDARYNLGINDVNDGGVGHIKNRVFAVGVFYQFKH
jgi:Outer membrane protein beta-barrel domain